MFIATDIDTFKTRFVDGLQSMLDPDTCSIGAFILVLANSMQDDSMHQILSESVKHTFTRLSQQTLHAPADDQAVFLALQTLGIAKLSTWQIVNKAPWDIIYNPLRALRPARTSQQCITTLQQAFNPNDFHFNKAFLAPEILWEGCWNQRKLRVLYNKFPFAPWHLLIVPEAEQSHPQFLTEAMHHYIMALALEYADIFTGFGIGFNSLGAYASINQLHFQAFIRSASLPIEASFWQHNGGKIAYPIHCDCCHNASDAWQIIARYHQNNQPYNLLYRAECCYILSRSFQGTVDLAHWAEGLAWQEACGIFTLSTQQMMENLSAEIISKQLLNISS